MYWKVRWEASPVDGGTLRTMVVYKERLLQSKKLSFGYQMDSNGLKSEGLQIYIVLSCFINFGDTVIPIRCDMLDIRPHLQMSGVSGVLQDRSR